MRYLKAQGNDLITPMPQYGFEGLKPGNRWCVCLGSWLQAYEDGMACPVVLEATHSSVLQMIPLEVLQQFNFNAGVKG